MLNAERWDAVIKEPKRKPKSWEAEENIARGDPAEYWRKTCRLDAL